MKTPTPLAHDAPKQTPKLWRVGIGNESSDGAFYVLQGDTVIIRLDSDSSIRDEKIAKRTVYAWAIEDEKFVAVLKEPPVDSPLSAVRVWIASLARK